MPPSFAMLDSFMFCIESEYESRLLSFKRLVFSTIIKSLYDFGIKRMS